METRSILSRPNGIFKAVTEHRSDTSYDVDIEFTSGLKLHQEQGKDLVVISDGQSETWKGYSLRNRVGSSDFLLPRDGDPNGEIGIDSPTVKDLTGHYSQQIQLQSADGEASMLMCTGDTPRTIADVGMIANPDGTTELWGSKCGNGHVTPEGLVALATDSVDHEEVFMPFLLAPVQMGHRYPQAT